MISLLLFFLLLSSGSVFATTFWGKKYEETVPLTAFAAVELVYLIGLTDHLRLGVYILCGICAVLYLLSVRQIAVEKSWKMFFRNTFTPAFFIFLALFFLYAVCLVGRVAWRGDEFSFWAVSVKRMWYLDAYSCMVPDTSFGEYPPGMQVFEFILLVLYGGFSEWRMQFAYVILTVLCALPFLKGLRWQEPFKILGIGIILFCAGTIFYPSAADNLMVDFALSCTFAYGMATVLLPREDGKTHDLWTLANVSMAATMMILIKQAGKLFAAMVLIALFVCWIQRSRASVQKRPSLSGKKISPYVGLILVPIVTAALWTWKFQTSPARQSFDAGKYDWKEFFLILLGRTDGGYRSDIYKSFLSYIATTKITVGFLSVTYLQVFLLLSMLFICLYVIYRKHNVPVSKWAVGLMLAYFAVYLLGILASYMYTFSEGEGTSLASIDRYLNIYVSGLLFVILFMLYAALVRLQVRQSCAVLALTGVLCFVPYMEIANVLLRTNVENSIAQRAPLQMLCDQIYSDPEASGDEDTVLLIHREGYPHWPVNHFTYLLYPDFNVPWECSYGSELLFDGDYYTKNLTAEEFCQHISDLGVDYIAISYVDQNFIDLYGSLFDTLPADGNVYHVTNASIPYTLLTTH